MLKWLLILFGGAILIVIMIFCILAFAVWNHERGYPKSILLEELKGTCVASKQAFVFIKTDRGFISEKMFDFLPKPDGRNYIYDNYDPGTVTKEDGTEAYDLTDAIAVPAGTRFVLKDGFQNRNLNGSQYYFWLEPETLVLDSSYFFTPLGLRIGTSEDGDNLFYSAEEMAQFPENELFEKACPDG